MIKKYSAVIFDQLIYIGIFALFIIPFLNVYNYFPVSKFYSEIAALGLASFIGLIAIYRGERLAISTVGIASLLFAIYLVLQIVLVKIRIPGINLDIAIEFLVAAAMSIGITSYIDGDEKTQQKLIAVIAWAVLVSTTIQAIYGFLQFTGQAANFNGVMLYVNGEGQNIFGNVGQKNDYVDFLTMGVFALSYLFFIKQINRIVYIIYALFFAIVITVNTSRTSFTFFVFALVIALLFMWFNRKNTELSAKNKQIVYLILSLLVGLFIVEALFPKIISMFSQRDVTSGLYRFSSSDVGQSTYRRFYEWYKDIIIFINHPLFGIGWYQYPREAIDLMMTDRFMYIPANQALYTHSHNSPLNILAETGIVGFAITMLYGFAYTLYKMFRSFNNHATLFLSFIILTIFAQSLFQYPLWYAYFLMFFTLFLSVNKPSFSVKNNLAIKALASVVFIGFMYFCMVSIGTYSQLVSYTAIPQDSDDYVHNVRELTQMADHNILWTLPALMVLDNYLIPTNPLTNSALSLLEQQKYIDELANEMPYPGAIFKQIIIHRLNGDEAGSLHAANVLAHGYPFFKDKFAAQLQSSPVFNKEVSAIYNFQYQDKSIFSRMFSKKEGQ